MTEKVIISHGDRLRISIDHLLEGVQVIARDWTYLYLNETAARHGQRAVTDLVGLTMMEAYPGIGETAVFQQMARVMDGGAPEKVVNDFVFPSGETRTFDLRIEPVPDGICVISIDITERLRTEASLRSVEFQLQQSQKMEAIGRLAGGIAHDFNNQLTAILGFCDLALAGVEADSQVAQDISEVRRAGQRASEVTRQLLAFSRRQVLTIEPLDMNAVVTDIDRVLGRLLGEDITVVVSTGADVRLFPGDAGQIENVIINMAVNARDAMPSGGRLTLATSTIEFSVEDARQHAGMKAGRYTVLTISDTGHGMDADTRARIFEPFFTTKEPGKGTGLGLAIVYGVVSQMGGFIWVYSEPGQGATFRLYFPVTDDQPVVSRAAPEFFEPQGSGTVLVVEDEPAVRAFTVRALADHGYRVLQAESPGEALRILQETPVPVDLMVVDVVLKDQSGPEMMAGLADPPPVLFMSGYSEQHIRDMRGGHPSGLLQKPFTVTELLQRVAAVLQLSRAPVQ